MICSWCGSPSGVKMVKVDGRPTTPLCFRCFGIWRESGERPPAFRMRDPQAGPITGQPFRIPANPRQMRR